MRWVTRILPVVLVLGLLRLSVYTVDAAQYAFVTVLGRHTDTFDGASGETGAGLHIGWPWPIQAVQRLDRRLQLFDLRPKEELTYDPSGKSVAETLTLQAFVMWKVAGREGVDRFIRALGTMDNARSILQTQVEGKLGALIQQMPINDFISTELSTEPGAAPGRTRVDEKIDALEAKLLAAVKDQARDYGIDLVDIRLKRFNHPVQVRQSIFQRIRSERDRKAAKYQSEGDFLAKNIETETEQKVREMLAQARFEEEKIKGRADTEAMLIRNKAHSEDPEFYAFLKKMEKLQSILGDNRTVLLLSTHRPLFDLLFSPPRPDAKVAPPEKKNTKSGGG